MNSPVEEIKSRLSIEEVVGSYIELKSFGKTQKALCPFHREKTPSFVVSEERQSFYCFGCNKGGDIFTFVEEFEGVDFRGALKILAEKAGVNISEYQSSPHKIEERDALFEILDVANQAYVNQLEMSESAKDYVKKRGITEQTKEYFNLGYAPDSWSFILDTLKKRNLDIKLVEKSGLVIKKDGGGYYDRFRNRVMFPISDSSGRVIGFSGRTLSTDDTVAKYINSPETPIFKKRDVLFGMDKSKSHIRKLDFSILVEGQMDLVLSHQSGFRNTIATSGTALTEQNESASGSVTNLELAKRLSKNLVIAFDSDEAGKKAAVKNARIAYGLGMDVKIASLPQGKDPADVILSDKNDWRKVIKESRDVVVFQLEEIEKNSKDKKDVLKRVRTDIFPTVRAIPSPLEREHYINLIAERLGMRAETVIDEFESTLSNRRLQARSNLTASNDKSGEPPPKNPEDEERLYLASLISLKKSKSYERELGEFEEIFNESPESMLGKLKAEERERILFEAEAKREKMSNITLEIKSLLRHLKIKSLETQAREILIKIKNAESLAEKEIAQELLESYSKLSREIEALKEIK